MMMLSRGPVRLGGRASADRIISSGTPSAPFNKAGRHRGGGVTAAAASRNDPRWQGLPEETDLLDGRLDRCDLVESFSREAISLQGRPREDVRSYMEPAAASGGGGSTPRHSFPAWCEPLQSMDNTEVIDWSNSENDGWGASTTAEQQSSSSDGSSSSSSNTSDSSGNSNGGSLPPAAAAAAASTAAFNRGLCSSAAGGNSSARRLVVWGSSCFCPHKHALRLTAFHSSSVRRRGVAMRASPAGSSSPQAAAGYTRDAAEADDAPHYEGADSDTLFPPGSPEMDDPGHPSELAAAAKDLQAAVERPQPRPYINIQNGRWVPPTKTQAETMMGQLSQTGPDEGV